MESAKYTIGIKNGKCFSELGIRCTGGMLCERRERERRTILVVVVVVVVIVVM